MSHRTTPTKTPAKPGRPAGVTTYREPAERVAVYMADNPGLSIRAAARQVGLNESQTRGVHRVWEKHGQPRLDAILGRRAEEHRRARLAALHADDEHRQRLVADLARQVERLALGGQTSSSYLSTLSDSARRVLEGAAIQDNAAMSMLVDEARRAAAAAADSIKAPVNYMLQYQRDEAIRMASSLSGSMAAASRNPYLDAIRDEARLMAAGLSSATLASLFPRR